MNGGRAANSIARTAIRSVILMLGMAASTTAQTSGQSAARDEVLFSADVVLERAIVDEAGIVRRQIPPVRYRVTRSHNKGKRTTTLVYLSNGGPLEGGPTKDPYEGMRVEYDEDGSPLRILDKAGKPIAPTSGAAPGARPPAELTTAAYVGAPILRDTVSERGRKLRNDLGAPAGQFRGFDRYLTQQGEVVQEVLVVPRTAAPVEINVVRNGVLESHSVYEYEPLADGSLLQRKWRTETTIPGRPSERFVMQTTFSNVVSRKER